MGNGFTSRSSVTQPLLITIMAALLSAATTSGLSACFLQEPGVNQAAEAPSPNKEVSQNRGPRYSPPALTRKPQKPRNWTGTLVDAGCMTTAMSRFPSADETHFPDPLSGFRQTLQDSQPAPQGRNSRGWSPQGQPQTPSQAAWTKDSDGEPEASEQQIAMQTAQLKRAKVLEQEVKACTPTTPTTHYGLVISGGQLLKFDTGGDLKAKEAIGVSAVEPGKTLKARVTGVIQADDSARVASIVVKNRIPAPLVSSGR